MSGLADPRNRCPCGAALCAKPEGPPSECPGCGLAAGPLSPSVEAALVCTRDRLLPRGLWVAESLLSGIACLAFLLGYACAVLGLAILLRYCMEFLPGDIGGFLATAVLATVIVSICFGVGVVLRRRTRLGRIALGWAKRLAFAFGGRLIALGDDLDGLRRTARGAAGAALGGLAWLNRAIHPCLDGVPLAPLWNWPAGARVSHLRTVAQVSLALFTVALVVTVGPLVVIILTCPFD